MKKLRSFLDMLYRRILDLKILPFYKKSFILSIVIFIIVCLLIIFGITIKPLYSYGINIQPTFIFTMNIYTIEQSQTLYLLSAIAQSLAAIVALIFTISLVLAQISSKYSLHILRQFFDKYTYGYIILFVFTLLVTFWQLSETYPLVVKFCLILTSACLIFLFPFFLYIRERLNPEFQLDQLAKMAISKLAIDKSNLPTEINAIENIIFSSYSYNDYETFEKAISTLCKIAYEFEVAVRDSLAKDQNRIAVEIMTKLKDVSIKFIEDVRAPFIIAEQYRLISEDCIKKKNSHIPTYVSEYLKYISIQATDKGIYELANWLNSCLVRIGLMAIQEKREQTIIEVYIRLEELADDAIHNDNIELASNLFRVLRNYCKQTTESNYEDSAKSYSRFVSKMFHFCNKHSLWDIYSEILIGECEIILRAINHELWDTVEVSIGSTLLGSGPISTLADNSPNLVLPLGIDLVFIGSLSMDKNQDNFKEVSIQRLRELEAKINDASLMKQIANLSLGHSKNHNTFGDFKSAVESFIKEYDSNLLQ